jgi:hypothetical protein
MTRNVGDVTQLEQLHVFEASLARGTAKRFGGAGERLVEERAVRSQRAGRAGSATRICRADGIALFQARDALQDVRGRSLGRAGGAFVVAGTLEALEAIEVASCNSLGLLRRRIDPRRVISGHHPPLRS